MLRRWLGALIVTMGITGLVLAEETRGTITKIEDGTITVRVGGAFGKGKTDAKPEEKTFKIGADVKISRVAGKDKEAVTLSVEELKTAIKVTGAVFATIEHDG